LPKVNTTPSTLRPYEAHGVVLDWKEGGKQASGSCPFCSSEGKFTVSVAKGLWRCFSCNCGPDRGKPVRGGNAGDFLELLHETAAKTQINGYDVLAQSRSLLNESTLEKWGCVKSHLTGEWIVPGYDVAGKVHNLYRWGVNHKTGKGVLYSTPDTTHGLFGVHLLEGREKLFLTEGPWDAMALWEAEGGEIDVLAVPGCTTFLPEWASLFAGKDVVILYDSDHARDTPAGRVDGAGFGGVKRVCKTLKESADPPRSVSYLKWGPEGYDPTLPSGTDIRDFLKKGETLEKRREIVQALLSAVVPCPDTWVSDESVTVASCETWAQLVEVCEKAMYWTEGLDRAFSCMLACVISTETPEDRLWLMVVSPPSTGKSSLCDALCKARSHVLNVGVFKGFHSGYQVDKEGTENQSLAFRLKSKTMVTTDGDTLLQSPFKDQILAEARVIYDGHFAAEFKNKMKMVYEDWKITWILCGTSSLRALDTSELGQRFLSVVVMDDIDEDMEAAVNWSRSMQIQRSFAGANQDEQDSPERVLMKKMTGGYINYLRSRVGELLKEIRMPKEATLECNRMAEFTAFMRARPSEKQKEEVHREFSTRLVTQLTKLAYCLAVVMNKTTIDKEVMRRVRRTAMDTARGLTLKMAKRMLETGDTGTTVGALASHLGLSSAETAKLLRFLLRIKAVEFIQPKTAFGAATDKPRWRLTARLTKLCKEAMEDQP